MKLTQFFTEISPKEIPNDVFTLVGEIFPVITVGGKDGYNAMVGSGGGMGMLFRKPVTWCVFPKSRYTLELIKSVRKYTLSYFPDEHRSEFMLFGQKSGRDSEKMKETKLTAIETADGNMTFVEARLVIECKLVQISTPDIEDFYSQEALDYLGEAYKEPGDVRQYVFGEITHVWKNTNTRR